MSAMRTIVLAATIGLAALPAAAQHRGAPPAATPAGPPISCVPLSGIRDTQVRSDQVIDFRMSGRRVYRNTLPQPCPSLGAERRFSYRTSIGQLCSSDIITVFTTSGGGIQPLGSCGLGQFQPVVLAEPHR